MGTRANLQTMLEELLGSGNVYFQPPPTLQMSYPCIVYRLIGNPALYANDMPYTLSTRYSITIIDRNPDSLIPAKVAALRTSSFAISFPKDNLNHTVYNLYY